METEHVLDTFREVETPEGLPLRLRCAGMMPRALAWLIDFSIRIALMMVLAILLGSLGKSGNGLFLIFMFLMYWAYPVFFEVLHHGQTPGKRVMALRVQNDNGTPVTWLASLVRNFLRVVDMMPALYGFGLASGLMDRNARRLGDIVAGTVVVYVEAPMKRMPAPNVEAKAPPHALTMEERSAIVAFAERGAGMTAERQQELAAIIAPALQVPTNDAVPAVLAAANHFLGRR